MFLGVQMVQLEKWIPQLTLNLLYRFVCNYFTLTNFCFKRFEFSNFKLKSGSWGTTRKLLGNVVDVLIFVLRVGIVVWLLLNFLSQSHTWCHGDICHTVLILLHVCHTKTTSRRRVLRQPMIQLASKGTFVPTFDNFQAKRRKLLINNVIMILKNLCWSYTMTLKMHYNANYAVSTANANVFVKISIQFSVEIDFIHPKEEERRPPKSTANPRHPHPSSNSR